MENQLQIEFSGPVRLFHEQILPERATPVGYAALIAALGLKVPLPRRFYAIGALNRTREEAGWRILPPRYAPDPTLAGHLTFALKYEGLDLAVLKKLFQKAGAREIERIVRDTPTGIYARRLWFLYEWLLDERLDLPDAIMGPYVSVLDAELQWAVRSELVARQRVRNNLPGSPAFCPLVFRSEALVEFAEMDLARRARTVVEAVPRDLLARTAAFLLLQDSKSSYAIEGERPPQDRIQRWGRAIGEAGRVPLSLEGLLRLQAIVIGDARFVQLGLRKEGGFVGEHDRDSHFPLPAHISARAEDLASLMDGVVAYEQGPARQLDGVIAAAAMAFGFVYIHPFADGNGRLHRYLIHHVLAQHGYSPAHVVFPVSSAILERLDAYRAVLEDYSRRLLPNIDWEPTPEGNVRVLNDTADFYRYFDATPHAEFLYACVRKTIEEDLPRETEFLKRYDRFREETRQAVDMPERTVSMLFRFIHQNGGRLSKRRRDDEFARLTDAEVAAFEKAYEQIFR